MEKRGAWCIDHEGGKVDEINVSISDGEEGDRVQR